MEVLGGIITGAVGAIAYRRLRERHEQLPDLEAPLRVAGGAVATAVDTTGKVGARAWHQAETTAGRVADTPPVRVAVGAVAGVVGTAGKIPGAVTSRLPGLGNQTSADGAGADSGAVEPPRKRRSAPTTITVVAGSTKFHRPSCRYASNGRLIPREDAAAESLTACTVCQP